LKEVAAMSLLVLGYPTLNPVDYRRIQAIRAEHDPQFGMVQPHFTLVFPLDGMREEALTLHVRRAAEHLPPIDLRLTCALAWPEQDRPLTYVFLAPDAGFGRLVTLYDRLYSGPLAMYLRLDLSFVPHITVAACADGAAAFGLARDLNEEGIAMPGKLDRLTVVRLADGAVKQRAEIALGG
jgi:2'-5' RNA ligase